MRNNLLTGQVEIACKDGLGYLFLDDGLNAPVFADCITAQSNPSKCVMPENAQPELGLVQYIRLAGVKCEPNQARLIAGINSIKIVRFEIKCKSGDGYILDVPYDEIDGDITGHDIQTTPSAYRCLQDEQICKLTTHAEQITALSADVNNQLGRECNPEAARFVGRDSSSNTDLYELKCRANNDSEIVAVGSEGKVVSARACRSVRLSGAACELSATADH